MARIALLLSIVALTVALLGATPLGEAAEEILVPRGAVDTAQLGDGAVTSAKVKDRSLLARDFGKGALPRGPAGPADPPGTIEGVAAGGDLTGTRTLVLPTKNLPVGAFVTQIFNTGAPNRVLFHVCNATAKPLDPPLAVWAYVVWRQ